MTKEITKAFILQEMEDKFKLRELSPEKFRFSEEVIPIYDIEQHLTSWEVRSSTVSITSATYFLFFNVPTNERWLLRAYQVIFGATGAHKGTGLYIWYRPPPTTETIYLDMKKNQEVSYLVNLLHPVVLESGNRLEYLIDTYVSTQNLTINIDIQKEEIR